MDKRISDEKVFHDAWAKETDHESVDVFGAWNELACPENAWIARELGDLNGSKLLDIGCGLGESSTFFALRGADVTAIDISPEMLDLAEMVARRHGTTITKVIASATDLSSFEANSFDVVYGANMLHHVDIEMCLHEVYRVLRPGGIALFWDPVLYNPAIKIYRRMAAGVRTPDEHPLTRSDLNLMKGVFANHKVRFFWLSAVLIFVRFYLIDRIPPSESRYWKIIIEKQNSHRRFLRSAHIIDRIIIRLFPPLKWWCWNLAFVGRKS